MEKYRKKPVVIEAVQYTGENAPEIINWIWENGGDAENLCGRSVCCDGQTGIRIPTLEGIMVADLNDWIIKGVKGEFYPCKPDIFEATYDKE